MLKRTKENSAIEVSLRLEEKELKFEFECEFAEKLEKKMSPTEEAVL